MHRAPPFAGLLALLSLSPGCGLLGSEPPEYVPVTRPDGLVVQDLLVPETGREVQPGDRVAIHYEVWLEDGTLVDASRERARPAEVVVGAGEVFPGLERGLLGMLHRGRRRLTVPPELAYGAEGLPPSIPPDATLTIEVELLEVEPGDGG